MAKAQWMSRVDISTDAMYRTYGATLNAKLASVGLVQALDTGQVNWSTAVWGAAGHYEIWRFNDALQGTAPIFLRLEYFRNGGSVQPPMMNLRVGTGSNGSGTLTGVVTSNTTCSNNGTASANTYAVHYVSMVGGKLSIALSPDWNSRDTCIMVHRTSDATGADSAVGCIAVQRGNVTNANGWISTLNFQTPALVQSNVQGYNCLAIGNIAAPTLGTASLRQSVLIGAYPQPIPHIGICGFIEGEYIQGSTFRATPFGSTQHTYIAMPGLQTYLGSGQRIAMLWE